MANGYNAGDLNLSIQTISNDTIKSLDAVIERLSLIDKGLGTMSGFARGRRPYIRKSTSGSRTEKTYSVGRNGKEYLTLSKNIQRAEKSLKTITTQFDRQGKVLKNTTVDVDEYGNKITKIFGGYSKGKSKGGTFGFAKLGISLHLMRRFGNLMANVSKYGSDYTETLNLWETAMSNNLSVATEFVNKMNEAYGISKKTLMNAQAIFKNMIGSLGQIKESDAYSISEGITQMALDYASLYNVTFEDAFTKFQAALAGQVRPIRSVSGYDITETTLYQLYESLGGEKTMRQLTRTEKQLLSILAVFQQMNADGAVGDLRHTMGSFANQSRVWAESLNDVKTWLGVIINYTLQESGIMIKLNAILITAARYLEAVARSIGAVQSFDKSKDPFGGTEESAKDASEAIDELNGKLLDFDKFRALDGGTEGSTFDVDIDQKVLDAMKNYDSILEGASLEARKLSNEWLGILGYTIDGNGQLILSNDQLDKAKDKIDELVRFFENFDGLTLIKQAKPFLTSLLATFTSLLPIITSLSTATTPILTGIINVVGWIVNLLDKLGLLKAVIVAIISYKFASKIMSIGKNLGEMNVNFLQPFIGKLQNIQLQGALATTTFQKFQVVMGYVGAAVMSAFAAFTLLDSIISSLDGTSRKVVSIISIVAGALATVLGIILAIKGGLKGGLIGASIAGLGVGALIAGIKGVATNASKIPNYEMGASDIDSGTVFRAGEFGKTEAVYTGSNGKTNVANVKQMRAAFLGALQDWTNGYLDDELEDIAKITAGASSFLTSATVYAAVKSEAKKRGERFSKV